MVTTCVRWLRNSLAAAAAAAAAKRLKEILELVNQPQNIGSTDALSLRGLSELVFYSKDCEIARSFTRKSIEANASVDAYTTAGTADFLCKDYPSSIQNFENALRLVPNDNGWFITRYLGATLYNADRTDKILELLKSNIDSIIDSIISSMTDSIINSIINSIIDSIADSIIDSTS